MSSISDQYWAEPLPPGCPPNDAVRPSATCFYRFVAAFPPSERDFHSQRMLCPSRSFGQGECIASAVSLVDSLAGCGLVKKLPLYKNKRIVVMIVLPPESGLVKQTGTNQWHYSWWRRRGFDPIPRCKLA